MFLEILKITGLIVFGVSGIALSLAMTWRIFIYRPQSKTKPTPAELAKRFYDALFTQAADAHQLKIFWADPQNPTRDIRFFGRFYPSTGNFYSSGSDRMRGYESVGLSRFVDYLQEKRKGKDRKVVMSPVWDWTAEAPEACQEELSDEVVEFSKLVEKLYQIRQREGRT